MLSWSQPDKKDLTFTFPFLDPPPPTSWPVLDCTAFSEMSICHEIQKKNKRRNQILPD
jgi:hypothetical protein